MDRVNWDDIRLFLALAREGTLSGAARRLRVGVATISRRIERMERALGVPLFLRHQNGYDLTDQGAALLPRAEAVELAMQGMRQEADAQSDIRGMVRLASIESLVSHFVVPALSPLLAGNPELDVEILFSTLTVNLHRHDADLALRMVPPERGNLRVRRLAGMGFGLYGPPDGSVPGRHVTWPDMASLATPLRWSAAFGAADAPLLAMNTLPGQIEAVRRGVGVSVLPHFLARGAGLRLLANRLPDGTAMERPILLVTHGDLAASRRVLAVAQALVDEIGARHRELAEA
ncbi:LysR family transcriptional regulator [Tropicimonas sp. IMCC34043]|uniref:LysR family transcriptional regulator n=1 Tax=Tropicimonas sp. IMCC34043 TaxID=2248760 RepID=UPI000E266253|nr:LysR family transcriptional regulator [Tropicimonas sp. IMCC34043]